MGPRAGLKEVKKRKFWPHRDSNPLVVQPIASRYTDYATPALERHTDGKIVLNEYSRYTACEGVNCTELTHTRVQCKRAFVFLKSAGFLPKDLIVEAAGEKETDVRWIMAKEHA
jgi:hypothetical protein